MKREGEDENNGLCRQDRGEVVKERWLCKKLEKEYKGIPSVLIFVSNNKSTEVFNVSFFSRHMSVSD